MSENMPVHTHLRNSLPNVGKVIILTIGVFETRAGIDGNLCSFYFRVSVVMSSHNEL